MVNTEQKDVESYLWSLSRLISEPAWCAYLEYILPVLDKYRYAGDVRWVILRDSSLEFIKGNAKNKKDTRLTSDHLRLMYSCFSYFSNTDWLCVDAYLTRIAAEKDYHNTTV